ncbi:MAG TPA: choice-of-anchor D domain-containing protein [Solirubrobacteraceae bacterium]
MAALVIAGIASLACTASALTATVSAAQPGQVYGAGYNEYGELGNGSAGYGESFALNPFMPTTVVETSPSYYSSLELLSNGTVDAQGYNYYGELGDGTKVTHYTPEQVPGLTNVTAVASGYYFSLALLSNGTVESWGYDRYGQLGNGAAITTGCDCTEKPALVEGLGGVDVLEHVVAISAGYEYAMALLSNGRVVTWGHNEYGELGNSETKESAFPVEVSGVGDAGKLEDVIAISAGAFDGVALLSSDHVVVWGYGELGELGNGEASTSAFPVEVSGVGGTGKLEDVATISAGNYFNLALLHNGEVLGWGYNAYHEMADGTDTMRTTPIHIGGEDSPLTGVSAIDGGGSFGLATLANNSVVGWGGNSDYELGLGKGENKEVMTPTTIPGLSGVISLGHGGYNYDPLVIEGAFASLSGSSLAFGNQTTGAASAPQSVTLTNNGPAPLTVSGETLSGSAFAITSDTCKGAMLAAGATCSVGVSFTPTAAGAAGASLAFSSTAANTLPTVALSGTGIGSTTPIAAAAPAVRIASSKLKVAKGKTQVKLACENATCTGKLTLTAVVKTKVRHKGKTHVKHTTITLAKGSYTLAAGKTEAIALTLTKAGKKLTAKLGKHKQLKAKLTATLTGGRTVSNAVKLS